MTSKPYNLHKITKYNEKQYRIARNLWYRMAQNMIQPDMLNTPEELGAYQSESDSMDADSLWKQLHAHLVDWADNEDWSVVEIRPEPDYDELEMEGRRYLEANLNEFMGEEFSDESEKMEFLLKNNPSAIIPHLESIIDMLKKNSILQHLVGENEEQSNVMSMLNYLDAQDYEAVKNRLLYVYPEDSNVSTRLTGMWLQFDSLSDRTEEEKQRYEPIIQKNIEFLNSLALRYIESQVQDFPGFGKQYLATTADYRAFIGSLEGKTLYDWLTYLYQTRAKSHQDPDIDSVVESLVTYPDVETIELLWSIISFIDDKLNTDFARFDLSGLIAYGIDDEVKEKFLWERRGDQYIDYAKDIWREDYRENIQSLFRAGFCPSQYEKNRKEAEIIKNRIDILTAEHDWSRASSSEEKQQIENLQSRMWKLTNENSSMVVDGILPDHLLYKPLSFIDKMIQKMDELDLKMQEDFDAYIPPIVDQIKEKMMNAMSEDTRIINGTLQKFGYKPNELFDFVTEMIDGYVDSENKKAGNEEDTQIDLPEEMKQKISRVVSQYIMSGNLDEECEFPQLITSWGIDFDKRTKKVWMKNNVNHFIKTYTVYIRNEEPTERDIAMDAERRTLVRERIDKALGSFFWSWVSSRVFGSQEESLHDALYMFTEEGILDQPGIRNFLERNLSTPREQLEILIRSRGEAIKNGLVVPGTTVAEEGKYPDTQEGLYHYRINHVYPNATEEQKPFVKMLDPYGYEQKDVKEFFDNLKISKQNIAPQEWNVNGFKFKILEKTDPLGCVLGNITSCCQKINGAGEDCVYDGYNNPNSGFLAVFDSKDRVVSQSWIRLGSSGTLFLDNIETAGIYDESRRINKKNADNLRTAYLKWAQLFFKERGQHVSCGSGYSDITFSTKVDVDKQNEFGKDGEDLYSDIGNTVYTLAFNLHKIKTAYQENQLFNIRRPKITEWLRRQLNCPMGIEPM